jgi:hypothetical protein
MLFLAIDLANLKTLFFMFFNFVFKDVVVFKLRGQIDARFIHK